MRFDPGLQAGDRLTFGQLRNIFQCSNAGGVLPSKKLKTLVIVSNHIKGVADDKWEGDVLHYTGMGMNGDQTIDGSHNKILSESNTNGMTVHLFEVYVQNEYIYRGVVKLVQEPYQEFQKDSEGNIRRVWVFPVKVAGNIKEEEVAEDNRLLNRVVHVSDEKIRNIEFSYKRSQKRREKAIIRNGVELYPRNVDTALHALWHAGFMCEIDNTHPMFFRKNSEYHYAEPHHLVPVRYGKEFKYSLDVEENIVSLCPDCHKKLHYGQEYEELLKVLYEKRKELLLDAGIDITFERLKEMYEEDIIQ